MLKSLKRKNAPEVVAVEEMIVAEEAKTEEDAEDALKAEVVLKEEKEEDLIEAIADVEIADLAKVEVLKEDHQTDLIGQIDLTEAVLIDLKEVLVSEEEETSTFRYTYKKAGTVKFLLFLCESLTRVLSYIPWSSKKVVPKTIKKSFLETLHKDTFRKKVSLPHG